MIEKSADFVMRGGIVVAVLGLIGAISELTIGGLVLGAGGYIIKKGQEGRRG